MSSIRQRPLSAEKLRRDESAGKSTAVPPAPQSSSKVKVLVGVVAVALSASYALYTSNNSVTPTSVLPATYAVCSRSSDGIITVNEKNEQVQCMVVHDQIIVDVGSVDEIQARFKVLGLKNPEDSKLVIQYIPRGASVVPGMSDSHVHILEYGASRKVPLEDAKTKQAAVKLVKEYVLKTPDILNDPTKWVEAWGWDHTAWPVEAWPLASDFEEEPILQGRPICLQSKDGHAIWVSHKAMELSGNIPSSSEGGIIMRDAAGLPNGVFLDNAQDIIKKPALTEEDLLQRFEMTTRDALALGLTSVHDAGFDPVSLAFFKRRAALGDLPIRVYGMTYFDETGPYWGDSAQQISGKDTGRLTARSVKIFADGALRSGGAALFEPYTDNPETNGFMRIESSVLNDVIPRFLRDGWQVNVHAIGDRANSIVVDAFEKALEGANVTALRPRLEHAQIMLKSDMDRLGKLGIIASVQPTHAVSDMWYAEDRLGPERVKNLYAFRSLIESGARITLGSDFPVESPNPLQGFVAAITRLSPTGTSPHGPEGWFPEQRLTRLEALRGMTIDPAYASFSEDTLGSIEVGKRADFVVLSKNVLTAPAGEILSTKVLATAIDGVLAYGTL